MKKLMAMLLAVALLALPLAGMAEESFVDEAVANGRAAVQAISFAFGESGDAESDAILKDLFSSLTMTLIRQEGEDSLNSLAVSLGDKAVLTFDVATKGDDAYLRSNLLGENAIVVGSGEVGTIVEKFVNTLKALGVISDADIQEMQAQIEQVMNGGAMSALGSDDSLEMLMGIVQVMGETVAPILESAEEIDAAGQPANSDPAASAVRMEVTADAVVKMYQGVIDVLTGNETLMASMQGFVTSSGSKSGKEALQEFSAQIAELMPQMLKEPAVAELYMDEAGAPVAVTYRFVLEAPEEAQGGAERVSADMLYTRLTEEAQQAHHFTMDIGQDDARVAGMSVDVALRESGYEASVKFDDPEETTEIRLTSSKASEENKRESEFVFAWLVDGAENLKVTVSTVETKNGEDADETTLATVHLNGSAEPLFTVYSLSMTTDRVASLAEEEGVIRLAELDEQAFRTWFFGVVQTLMTWPNAVVQALPASLQQLVN